jgi:ubiquinone/menaquinone biosynthesis C-methylase UbiE
MKSEWMWNKLAANWDKPGVSLGQNDNRIIKKTNKYLAPGDIALDFGCATGSVALEIAGTVKEVHGIDTSSKMIDLAQRKAADRKLTNTHFIHSTIFDESLKKESFDAILSYSTLHLVKDIPQVFQRIRALLKPGGFFISATPCVGEKALKSILIVVPLFFASKTGLLPHVNFFSVSGLSGSIARQNFQIIETESLSLRPVTEVFIAARKE